MLRSLRALVSRCVGAGCGGVRGEHLQDAVANEAWGVTLEVSRLFGSLARCGQTLPTTAAAAARSGAASSNGATLPDLGPRAGALWLAHLQPASQAPRCCAPPLLAAPHAVRAYAKAAKGAAAAPAAAAPSGPKRPRVSWTKLYSCRNDRLRHTHEQIWPTMQLTEAELAMFRRNSRLFVVEMGRSISLQTKYRMGLQMAQAPEPGAAAGPGVEDGPAAASAAARKVPYQQARSLLHESQLHLDALGENPRYLKVRRVRSLFATKLQNVRKLRLLLGFQRRRFVQRMYEHSLLARGSHRMWKLVCAMEASPAMFATRMGLADDAVAALRALRDDKLYVNGARPNMPYRGFLLPGDVVSPGAGAVPYFRQRVATSLAPLEAEVVRYMM